VLANNTLSSNTPTVNSGMSNNAIDGASGNNSMNSNAKPPIPTATPPRPNNNNRSSSDELNKNRAKRGRLSGRNALVMVDLQLQATCIELNSPIPGVITQNLLVPTRSISSTNCGGGSLNRNIHLPSQLPLTSSSNVNENKKKLTE